MVVLGKCCPAAQSSLQPVLRRLPCTTHSKSNTSRRAAALGSERMEVQARKFYSQRNMYLCGFTLFLSLILNRTYVMILETLRLEEELKRMKGDPKAGGKLGQQLSNAGEPGEIARLKKELEAAHRNIETMKKQHDGFQKE